MKYLKLYENKKNWTFQMLFDRQEEKDVIEDAVWNYCLFLGKIDEDWTVENWLFLNKGYETVKVLVHARDMNEEWHAIYLDGNEFARYLNNPELFEETEKFNI